MVLMYRNAQTPAQRQRVLSAASALLNQDTAPCVRIAAAEAHAEFGPSEGALDVLIHVVKEYTDANATLAIGAIERLGRKAMPILDLLMTVRTEGYAARLAPHAISAIIGTDPLLAEPAKKAKPKRKPKKGGK